MKLHATNAKDVTDNLADTANDVASQGFDIIAHLEQAGWDLLLALGKAALIIFVYVLIYKFLMRINKRVAKGNVEKFGAMRSETIQSVIGDLIKYTISIFCFISILPALGIPTSVIVASSGAFAVIIGLGGSEFISDFINGFFALFEGYYDVGDYIKTGSYEGYIVELGLKSTSLRTANNEIVSIPNSSIIEVINLSKMNYSQFPNIGISYNEDLVKVERIINDKLVPAVQAHPEVISAAYLGVFALNASSVDLKFELVSSADDRFQAARILNRETKLLFDQHEIEIPFNQLVVHNFDSKNTLK